MAKYACGNAACPERGKPVESKTDFVFCGECAQQLGPVAAAAPTLQDQRFLDAVELLATMMGDAWNGSYQKRVTEDLLGRPAYYRQDFIDEMGREQERKRFAGNKGVKRGSEKGKLCVDNAIAAVGAKPLDQAIRGEKFTFEVPYLVSLNGFDPINGLDDGFATSFKELGSLLAPGQLYMVLAKKPAEPVGHMVLITVKANGDAFLTDAQKLTFAYGLYGAVGWHVGPAPAKPPVPYRPIDLAKGQLTGQWAEK